MDRARQVRNLENRSEGSTKTLKKNKGFKFGVLSMVIYNEIKAKNGAGKEENFNIPDLHYIDSIVQRQQTDSGQ